MSRNRSAERLHAISAAIAAADWARAEKLLDEHARDASADVRVLPLYRQLDDGRGARRETLARVTAFVAVHPELTGDPTVRVERGFGLRIHGEVVAARVELLAARDALRARTGREDRSLLARAEAGIGLTYLTPLDADRARGALQASRAIAEQAELLDQIAFADLYLAHVELEVGDVDRAARAYRSALGVYEKLGDMGGVRHASYNLGMVLHDLGRDRAARRHLQRSRELARVRGEHWYEAFATLILGELERKAGRPADAERHYAAAEALFTRIGGPSPTERAWIDMRRAELALDRGDWASARRLARAGLDPQVEPTPRMYGRLITAIARSRRSPTPGAVRGLEHVARDAESMELNEIAWRARTLAARVRLDLVVARRCDGERIEDSELTVVRGHVRRAMSTLEGTMGAMRTRGRGAYLRDLVRRDDARTLLELDAMIGHTRTLLTQSLDARAAWLRMLAAIGRIAGLEDPRDVAVGALDAILEVAGARRGFLWLDGRGEGDGISVGRDRDRRDLVAPERPSRDGSSHRSASIRIVEHARLSAGTLLLEDPSGGALDEESLELSDAIATVAVVLVDAARTRGRLVAHAEARAHEATELSVELARAEAALDDVRARLPDTTDGRGALVGRCAPMRELFGRLDRVRTTELPVLITGESGTGKELIARAVHDESKRGSGPLVAVNCGALAEGVLESELFGHVRGAFTGAVRDAPGLFVVADGGTLLLDEIGEMPLAMQAKLLRVLQEGEVRPLGAERARRVDVRVITATHRDLHAMVEARTFREDLYYRLHVVTVHAPPLRARGNDVLLLSRRFLANAAPDKRLAPDAAAWLIAQTWPGNVRELRAVIDAAAILCDGDTIHARDLASRGSARRSASGAIPERLDELEAYAIARALERHGSRVAAARALGIGRATLYRKLLAYGLGDPRAVKRMAARFA